MTLLPMALEVALSGGEIWAELSYPSTSMCVHNLLDTSLPSAHFLPLVGDL